MREQTERRDFLSHVGKTLGILAIGGSSAASTAAAEDTTPDEPEITTLEGEEREQLLRRANRSEDVRQVVRFLDEKPEPSAVFTFDNQDRYGVTFGTHEGEGTVINYREGESVDGGSTASGGTPMGDGVRSVETSEGSMMSIGTQYVRNVAARVPGSAFEDVEGSPAKEQSVFIQEIDGSNHFDLYVPIVQNDEVVDRLVYSSGLSGEKMELVDAESGYTNNGKVSPLGHKGCDPVVGWLCTDYCTILCASVAAVSAAGCAAACSGTIAGIPLSVSCATFCGSVAGSTCYETCETLAGH
ncbi:hypothetical protein [Halovenus marina]|uniref:hypothetical protein n=1 Tax=Halovenus marina TaxID=3396621 RepID=UPI003F54278E